MKNATLKSLLTLIILCFCSITFANECKEGQRTIEDWLDHNGTFKELSLPKKLIESEVCFYEPGKITPTGSFPEINSFVKKWKHVNNVRGEAKGQTLVNLIKTLASEFDLSLGQVCFNVETKLPAACEKQNLVYVSIQQSIGVNKAKTQKLILGKFAG